MKSVLFVDNVCPKSYDSISLEYEPMGGTEASVVRVAEALGKQEGYEVRVEQHNRTLAMHTNAEYLHPEFVTQANYVICLRDPAHLVKLRARFKDAKLYLWMHDLLEASWAPNLKIANETGAQIICVSNFHKTQVLTAMASVGLKPDKPIIVLYNPIDDNLKPDDTPYDKNKLVWFSSPHKGLDYAIDLFRGLKRFNKDFKFYISNPGYFDSVCTKEEGIINLGTLSHSNIIAHVRQVLCVFNPNRVFPETFGCVFAEADAVGTPTLTHVHGASTEVLFHPYETLDCNSPKAVIDRVMAWHNGDRPIVKGQEKFRTSSVIKDWIRKVLT